MKVGRSFWVVLILLVISFLFAFKLPLGETQLYNRLTYVWVLLLAGSWVWSYFSIKRIRIIRQARTHRQQVGQVFEERLEIMNDSWLPRLWLEILDGSTLPGSAASRVLTWVGGRQTRSYLAYTWLNTRGLFTLGPTTLVSGDVFGLFRSTRELPTNERLLVVPYMVDLVSFPSPHGLLPGGKAIRQRTTDVTPYAAGVREYLPGDSLSRIHWPTTVRRDRLMVKEFDEDPQAEVWIFIDAQKDVHAALPEELPVIKGEFAWLLMRKVEVSLPSATIEYAVSVAASIANFFISHGQEVGFACAGQAYTVLTAERGERQMGKILENLALLQPAGDLPFFGLTTAVENHLPKGSTVVMITPSTDNGIALAASEITQRSMNPVVILIDPETFGGKEGSKDLDLLLQSQGIPVIRIANHENLKQALEKAGKPVASSSFIQWKDGDEEH